MKKYLTHFVLLVMFSLTLVGCNGCTNPETTSEETITQTVETEEATTNETTSEITSEITNTTLTLATFGSSTLPTWVAEYNENNTDNINIEIVDYQTDDALNQLKIEIVAGKGPDLIDFGLYYSPLLASSGIMSDLYPFLKNDTSFDREDFHENIIDSFAIGESLYVIVPSFHIDSYATTNNNLSGLEQMNISQLVEAYDMRDDGVVLFPGETKMSVLGTLLYGNLENFVDWDSGVCYFDGDSFKELLHFANQFPLSLNFAEDYSVMDFFTEGRTILYPVYIDNVYTTAKTRALFGETPTYIGFPVDSGNGNMADIASIAIGITSTSNHKDEAWKFIKTLLGEEFQDNTRRGLPIRISSLDKKIALAMENEYDADGQKIVKDQLRFEGETPIDIYEIDSEDAETLLSIIGNVTFSAMVDDALYSIIIDEASYLFNDGRNVDETAKIIQNRATIYVQENK